ncbi:unnamed protein product [Leuciscus chuanchicus]
MASSSSVAMDGDFMRHAEYTPKSTVQSETDIDKRLAGTLMAVGLGVAAAGFAGRYAFHLWRPLGQVITEAAKKLPTTSFSAYYKGGFEQKMTRREASLILGISFDPITSNGKNSQLCLFLIYNLLFGGPPSSSSEIRHHILEASTPHSVLISCSGPSQTPTPAYDLRLERRWSDKASDCREDIQQRKCARFVPSFSTAKKAFTTVLIIMVCKSPFLFVPLVEGAGSSCHQVKSALTLGLCSHALVERGLLRKDAMEIYSRMMGRSRHQVDPRIWQPRSMKQKICLTLALDADQQSYIYFSAASSPMSLHKCYQKTYRGYLCWQQRTHRSTVYL